MNRMGIKNPSHNRELDRLVGIQIKEKSFMYEVGLSDGNKPMREAR